MPGTEVQLYFVPKSGACVLTHIKEACQLVLILDARGNAVYIQQSGMTIFLTMQFPVSGSQRLE